MSTAPTAENIVNPGTHILELAQEALRVAKSAARAAAEGIATGSAQILRTLRDREKELDSLDRDVDDLVTATISGASEAHARELLACMKFVIALERIGDLLLSFGNRAGSVAVRIQPQDVKELTMMASGLERMLSDVDIAFCQRNLERAVTVLRSDGELDRLRNLILMRHLEPGHDESRQESFHVIAMAQELERAGDHAKNMAEEVCHLVSGRTVRHVLRTYDKPVVQLQLDRIRTHPGENCLPEEA
ncbi:MAG: phosphate uptake regulator PhoU [Terriglobia bacterium]|jgi:phosphate transport system protein|nr:phosphate uptake regulator PhoU [Terriglobia bacterium]